MRLREHASVRRPPTRVCGKSLHCAHAMAVGTARARSRNRGHTRDFRVIVRDSDAGHDVPAVVVHRRCRLFSLHLSRPCAAMGPVPFCRSKRPPRGVGAALPSHHVPTPETVVPDGDGRCVRPTAMKSPVGGSCVPSAVPQTGRSSEPPPAVRSCLSASGMQGSGFNYTVTLSPPPLFPMDPPYGLSPCTRHTPGPHILETCPLNAPRFCLISPKWTTP